MAGQKEDNRGTSFSKKDNTLLAKNLHYENIVAQLYVKSQGVLILEKEIRQLDSKKHQLGFIQLWCFGITLTFPPITDKIQQTFVAIYLLNIEQRYEAIVVHPKLTKFGLRETLIEVRPLGIHVAIPTWH